MVDVERLSMEDWMQLEDWELENALQQVAGQMALCQANIRDNSEHFYLYSQAKSDFANWTNIGKMIQSLLRSKRA